MEIQLLLTAAVVNLKKLLNRVRALSLETRNALKNNYKIVFHNLFACWSNFCPQSKRPVEAFGNSPYYTTKRED